MSEAPVSAAIPASPEEPVNPTAVQFNAPPKSPVAPAGVRAAAPAGVRAAAPAGVRAAAPDPLSDLEARFNDRMESDKKFKEEAGALNLFFRHESEPSARIRIGVSQGIHTYALVAPAAAGLRARLYAMIPSRFNDFIVPFLKESGVEIQPQAFIRPSGI